MPDNVQTSGDAAQDTCKQCGLRAVITYADGSTEYHYAPFHGDVTGWQFTSLTIVPKEADKTVATIRVVCAYEQNGNTASFDNISLTREVAQTMTYDEEGNLISSASTGLTEDTNTYENGNLIQTVTGSTGTYTYSYDETYQHRLTEVTNGLITEALGYDDTGNVTSTVLSDADNTVSIHTSATYSSDGNLPATVTDNAGSITSYQYETDNSVMWGVPTSVTGTNAITATTSYDALGRVTETGIAGTATLAYTYYAGLLTQVKRTAGGEQTYCFTYDSFGNMLSLSIGSRVLATYTYGPGNGLLLSQTYGNGGTVTFTYDTLGRGRITTYF